MISLLYCCRRIMSMKPTFYSYDLTSVIKGGVPEETCIYKDIY